MAKISRLTFLAHQTYASAQTDCIATVNYVETMQLNNFIYWLTTTTLMKCIATVNYVNVFPNIKYSCQNNSTKYMYVSVFWLLYTLRHNMLLTNWNNEPATLRIVQLVEQDWMQLRVDLQSVNEYTADCPDMQSLCTCFCESFHSTDTVADPGFAKGEGDRPWRVLSMRL